MDSNGQERPDNLNGLKALARQLVQQGATPRTIQEVLHQQHQDVAFELEQAKTHPLLNPLLDDAEWGALCNHLLDGGGVIDDRIALDSGRSLRDQFITALVDRDQANFWPLLAHLVKALLKREGHVQVSPEGAVSLGPHGSNARERAMEQLRMNRLSKGKE